MEYNRMMAYIYSYDNGLKCRNTGFARIEVRGSTVRMHIGMKNAFTAYEGDWTVNFFYREDERIIGIELGKMHLSRGMGEFSYSSDVSDIEGKDIPFSKIKGLYISNGGDAKVFASEWDDKGFHVSDIGAREKYKAAEAVEVIDEYPQISYEEDIKNSIDEMIDGGEKLLLFADDDLYDCVEIDKEDILKLPETNWSLKNNSFVNHGFYNFRHLIIGKTGIGNGCGYFIGVPGVYTRRDRTTASIFGFNNFKFSMRSDVRLSQFGYWYKMLEV